MTFEEYQKEGRIRYLALVEATQNILMQALRHHGLVAHSVTGRAKEIGSLRKKLDARGIAPDQPMDEIKDLAGCRIVFLTNSLVRAFTNTGALTENFTVSNMNVHYPVPLTDTESLLFDSTNYLCGLKPDRLALVEYREFEGLKVEIQVQTLLNHAWAEMGHDTIYKQPKLNHLGETRLVEIGERMNKVMEDHLVPAGHDFDKIAGDFQLLVEADTAVPKVLEAIYKAKNNNDIEDALTTLKDVVLPRFDHPDQQFLKHFDAIVDAVERSRGYDVVAIETPFGTMPGKTSLAVARSAKEIISSFRYYDIPRTLKALIRLFDGGGSNDERQLWIEVGEALASHQLKIWTEQGPVVQEIILQEVSAIASEQARPARELLTKILAKSLSAEVQGTDYRSDSVTLHRGSVRISETLRRIRNRALDILETWLDEAADDRERVSILRAMGAVDEMPMNPSNDDALICMLMEDGARVVRGVRDRAARWGLELRRDREINALRTYHRFQNMEKADGRSLEFLNAKQGLIDALLMLRDDLNADDEFKLYKTLLGYDSVRPEAWGENPYDYEATTRWRREMFPGFVDRVTEETVEEWRDRIDRFLGSIGSDGGNFWTLGEFLQLLAERKPDVALLLLNDPSEELGRFLCNMLDGLVRAGRSENVRAQIDRWIGEARFFRSLGVFLEGWPEAGLDRLVAYLGKAVELQDRDGVAMATKCAFRWYRQKADGDLISLVGMQATRFAIDDRWPDWIHWVFTFDGPNLVKDMTRDQASEYLRSFRGVEDLTYQDVQMLKPISSTFPELVIEFFDVRISGARGNTSEQFDAIPFNSHGLAEVLSPHVDLMLEAARRWFATDPVMHQFLGGRLLNHAFPKLTKDVSGKLEDIATSGRKKDLRFVVETLTAYDGAKEIYPAAMAVVERLEPGDRLLGKVSMALSSMGIVRGQYGRVEGLASRRELIREYLNDGRPRVRSYAENRLRELGQDMAWEQRRAAAEAAKRKRDWGEE